MPRSQRPPLTPLLTALLLILCSACGTFVAHSVPTGSPDEIVDLRCYARYYFVYIEECHITSVDGLRPGLGQFANLGAELTPGRHWIEFEIERYFGGAGGTAQVCAFENDFSAGTRYRIVAHSLETDVTRIQQLDAALYGASIELAQSPPDGAPSTQRIELVCAPGGSLCRTAADCEPHTDKACQLHEGHAYGTCSLRQR
jgi:hypothetical protein